MLMRTSKSQMMFEMTRLGGSRLEIEASIPSRIEAISPLVVSVLIRVIETTRCVTGAEFGVEMALREAVANAVLHGNHLDAHKLVQVCWACELGKGLSIVVKDQGEGFDLDAVADPLAAENVQAEHGRGASCRCGSVWTKCHLNAGGAEVHMRKAPPK